MLCVRDDRREPRKVLIARVQLRWQDAAGLARLSTALVEDLSKSGAGIRISEAIVPGTRLEVAGRGEVYFALVKNCRPDGAAYLIGVQREPDGPAAA